MTPEQLRERRKGIGSSDAPIVMGISPWKTPFELWQDKVYGNSVQLDNPSMKRGRDLEEPARQEFEKIIGTLVAPDCIVHRKFDCMRASLDGIDADRKVMVEIKCPNKEDHSLALNKKIPEKYWPQVQHQMEVAGLDQMYYFSFDGSKGVVVEVKKDKAYVDSLLEKEADFWELVTKKTPPELTDRDYLDMEEDEQWKLLCSDLLPIIEQKKALEDKEKIYRGRLISLSQGRSSKGCGVMLQRQICKGNVDYSSIPNLQGVDLDQYRKNSFEKWVVRSI